MLPPLNLASVKGTTKEESLFEDRGSTTICCFANGLICTKAECSWEEISVARRHMMYAGGDCGDYAPNG